MDANLIVISSFMLCGIMEMILGLPLVYNKVKRNMLYGFRTRKTLSDDDIWEKANKKIGRELLIIGLILTLGSILLLFIRDNFSIEIITIICLNLLFIPLIVLIIRGFSHLKTL